MIHSLHCTSMRLDEVPIAHLLRFTLILISASKCKKGMKRLDSNEKCEWNLVSDPKTEKTDNAWSTEQS